MIYVLISVWLASTIASAGLFFAHIQSKYPDLAKESEREDLGNAFVFGGIAGLLGPIGVLMALCLSGFAKYGWRLWPKARDKSD